MIKAIETHYAGCRFRSRLEAKWAVFLDAIDIEWRYEPEGYQLKSGWYLPDFYLPANRRWIEVKGGSFTRKDRARGAEFAEERWQHGEGYRLLHGDIPRQCHEGPDGRGLLMITMWSHEALPIPDAFPDGPPDLSGPPSADWQLLTGDIGPGTFLEHGALRNFTPGGWLLPATITETNAALTKARSARFEHGERG